MYFKQQIIRMGEHKLSPAFFGTVLSKTGMGSDGEFLKFFKKLSLYEQNTLLYITARGKEEFRLECELYESRLEIGALATAKFAELIMETGKDGYRGIYPEKVKYFLKLGPDFRFEEETGSTIPQLVIIHGNGIFTVGILRLLEEHGADLKNVRGLPSCARNGKPVHEYLKRLGCGF